MHVNEHVRRRANAAAAAAASEILPVNSKRFQKKKNTKTPTEASPSSHLPAMLPSDLPDLPDLPGVPDLPNCAHDEDNSGRFSGKSTKPPATPPGPLPRSEKGELPLMQSRAGIDADESFGSQEYALSSYLKLHPVLSLESTSYQTLQLVANLVETTSIPTKELEIVSKPHDDGMLRPPNTDIGERPCCLGDRCICVWMARWRYGEDTDKAFVATEFLLPSQSKEFKESGKLPHTVGKCLVCSRYVHTFIYKCARADPTFKPDILIPIQAFGNSLGVESGNNVPTHSSVANDSDGYRQEALLFVDEQWADTAAARGSMASLLWRPCVKFDSTHYVYIMDSSGKPRLLQRNVSAEDESSNSHFCQPTEESQRPSLSANLTTRPHSPTSSNPQSPHSSTS